MKKILISIFLLTAFYQNSFAINQNEISDFYYLKTIETISKYIDDKHTTLWFLYEYNDFLDEKLKSEKIDENKEIINSLIILNKENIIKQLNSLDINNNNIEIFIKYFLWKNPEYTKFIEIIKKENSINAVDENWDTIFWSILKNWTYEDIDFALSRWVKPIILNKAWNLAFYDFIKTWWKFYPKWYIDKILAWKFDEKWTIDIIKNVIKKWFNLNLIDLNKQNITFYAIDLWNQKITDLIINNQNVNLNIKNKDWFNSLFYAISTWKNISIIKSILAKDNFDINATDNNWDNIIAFTWNKDIKIFEEILKKNIEINTQNKLWESEIIKMMKSEVDTNSFLKKYDLFKWYKKIDLSLKDNLWNDTLLTSASLTWWLDIFRNLIKDYNNIETQNNSGSTLLHIATEKWNLDFVKELLKNSIDINKADNDWNLAINIAAKNKNYDILDLLLKNKSNVDNVNNIWENILYTWIKDNDEKIVSIALANKANSNTKVSEEKINLFLYAVKNNKTSLVKIILQNNKNSDLEINTSDKDWKNALFYAIENKNLELLKMLIEYQIDINNIDINWDNAIIYSALKSDYNSFSYLIKANANYNKINKAWKNALILACEQDDLNIIKKLVDLWININQKDKSWNKCIDYIKSDSKIWLELYNKLK